MRVVELHNATVNPPAPDREDGPHAAPRAGEGNYGLQPKSTASEDSFYQQKVPGLFFLGVTPKGTDGTRPRPTTRRASTWMSPA